MDIIGTNIIQKRRVVVTGIGIISPFGVGVDNFWNSVLEGKSCIDTLKNISTEGQTVKIGGEVKVDLEALGLINPKEAKRMDRYTQLAMAAADEAVRDADISVEKIDPFRYGVIVGSAVGGFDTFEKQHLTMLEKGPIRCSPFTVPMIISNMGAARISIKHGAKGVNKAVVTACASSAHCIGDAFRSIQYNDADIIITGGAETLITKLGLGALTAARSLSKRNDEPQKASRPFDKDRDGFVMSEGAAIIILEDLECAKKRGAKIYAEIIGYGQTADAYDVVAPEPSGAGASMAMEIALKDANIEAPRVDYINAHATGTYLGDIVESNAIARIFGDLRSNKNLKVSSTKSMHGHMIGATGAVESIVCIEAIMTGKIPPTINLDNQDEAMADLNYVPHKAIKADVKYAMTNSLGFGGQNASLLFQKYE